MDSLAEVAHKPAGPGVGDAGPAEPGGWARRFDARALIAAATLSLLSGIAAVALLMYQRDHNLQQGGRLTEAFASVVDEQTTRTLQALDQRLESIALQVGRTDVTDGAALAMLEDHLSRLPFVGALFVLDGQGQVRFATRSDLRGAMHDDKDYFRIFRTRPGAVFYLGQPQQPADSLTWDLPASRPVFDGSGRFSGVVVATLQASHFSQLWSGLALESGSAMSLLRSDGTLMLRSPLESASMGRNYGDGPLFRQFLPMAAQGNYHMNSPIDGAERLIAYRTLAQFPDLIVVVGRTIDAVLAPWRQMLVVITAGWLLGSVALIAAAIHLGRVSAQRKAAERRGLQMAQRLSIASDAAGIVLWDWILAQGGWRVTPSYYHTLGLEPGSEFVLRDAWLERVHPDDRSLLDKALATIQPVSRDRYQFEARMRHADGSYRWIQEIGHVQRRSPEGRPLQLMGVRLDITDRKRQEHERAQLLERITDGFIALDTQWRFTYVNARAGELLDRRPADLIGKCIWDELPPLPDEPFPPACQRAMAEQQPSRLEAYYPDLGLWLEDHIYPSPDGVSIFFRDITQHKADELSLRQAKEQAETLLANANVLIVGLDVDGNITLFNSVAQKLTGYTLADLAGRNWFDILCPRQRYPQVWQEFERAARDGTVRQFENPILTSSGRELTISWQNSLIRDADGVTGTLSFGIDVTARCNAEQELSESRDQFQTLADHSIQGIALVRKGQITYVNAAFCAITGRNANELTRLSLPQLMQWMHPDDRAASIERQRKALQGKAAQEIAELRIWHPDGGWRWIQSATRSITLRGEPAMLAMMIDIHERKLAEVAVRESEERFRGIFESSAIGISLADAQGRWIMVNPALCDIVGYAEPELLQLDYETISHPDDMVQDRVLTAELYEGKRRSFQMEKRYRHRDGRTVWINLTVALVRDGFERPVHTVAHVEDITERKRLEQELRSSKGRLRATLDALPDLMFEVDLDGRYHDYHSHRADLLVAPPELLMGRRIAEVMPPEAARTVQSGLHEAMERGHAGGLQILLELPVGPHWFELSIARKAAEPDESPRFIVLSRDITDRIRTQQALRSSEALMRQMADSVSQIFWLVDLQQQRYLYISPAVEAVLGCRAADMADDPQYWRRNIHPLDRERVLRQLAVARATCSYDMQFRLQHPDGSLRWIHARAYPVAGPDQLPYRCAGVIEDITARRTLAIREEHEREILQYLASGIPMAEMLERFVLSYEAMVPGMLGSVLLLDPGGSQLRHGAAPHLPQAYCDAIDGAAIGPAAGSCGTAAYTGDTVIAADIANDVRWIDYRDLALPHGLRACWSVPIKGMQGHVLGTFAFYFDHVRECSPSELATIERGAQLASQALERLLAVRELQASEERYRTLVEWSPEGIAVHQHDRLAYVNPAGAAIVGAASAEEVTGKPLLDFVDPQDRDEVRRMIERILDHGVPSPLTERRFVRLDGSVIDVETKAGPITIGGAPAVQVVMRDITARKQAEADLRDSREQLRILSVKVLAAQETERRRIAHELHDELGQALTAIKINLQAEEQLGHGGGDGLQADNIRIVEGALQQVRSLALALRPSMLDDLGLVPALRWLTEQTSSRHGVQMELQAPSRLRRLPPDLETAVFRIVQEALTNVVRHAQARHVHVGMRLEGPDQLLVQIRDDGVGFDVAAMRRRASEGNSIGVLGMQERATLVGGRLTITSAPGQGCTVTVRCPIRTVADH
ncbi:PAS domain S-box protein [Comamonadaceae bacterium G21597-S1]|nr:PAS domain S-box protein [Comamonadaceae bacterium G21597-S1]